MKDETKSLLKRIVTALVLIGVVFMALLWWRHAHIIFVDVLVLAAAAIAVYELLRAFQNIEIKPMWLPVIITFCIIYPLTWFYEEAGIFIALTAGLLITLSLMLFSKKFTLKDAVATIFSMLYPLSLTMLLIVINHKYGGVLGIVLILAVAVLTDTLAFFIGKGFGKRKLCPEISPKKTVAGAVGGVCGGILGAVLVFVLDYFDCFTVFAQNPNDVGVLESVHIFANNTNWVASLFIYITAGVLGAILCQLGDLTASYIKRRAGIKDFGSLFPGHGGVMDRLDGILFVVPVVYFIFRAIVVL